MKTATDFTPEQRKAAQALQPELKRFITSVAMHQMHLTEIVALWHLERVAPLESQIANMQREMEAR
jgi:hypothetical protein